MTKTMEIGKADLEVKRADSMNIVDSSISIKYSVGTLSIEKNKLLFCGRDKKWMGMKNKSKTDTVIEIPYQDIISVRLEGVLPRRIRVTFKKDDNCEAISFSDKGKVFHRNMNYTLKQWVDLIKLLTYIHK